MSGIVIVGGSLAGLTAASTLRRAGTTGPIHVVDRDPGPPVDRPPLSKEVLRGERTLDEVVLGAARDDAIDLTWHRGVSVTGVDVAGASVHTDHGPLPWDDLVLAPGVRPRTLAGAAGMAGVHVLRTGAQAEALRRELTGGSPRVVVIGAGFIGGEVAASCRALGLEVAMVEAAPVPLVAAVGEEVGALMAELHRSHGVDVRLGVGVSGLEQADGRVHAVALDDGTRLPADVVVVGIGADPDLDWLGDSGLPLDRGIVADASLRVAPGVVAAGDAVRWTSARHGGPVRVEHWDHAVASGEAAARTLLADRAGEPAPVYDPLPWFWTDQYDRKLQLAGTAGPGHQLEVVDGSLAEHRFAALVHRDGRLTGVIGMNRPRHVLLLRPLVDAGADLDAARARAAEL